MAAPKPDKEKDARVKKLRNKNKLTYREIAKITGEDVKNVWVRYQRAVGNLSTA